MGHNDRPFHIRFLDHFCIFKYKNGKSKLAQYLTDNGHSIAPMENVMEILHVTKKFNMMNTLEKFHTYTM